MRVEKIFWFIIIASYAGYLLVAINLISPGSIGSHVFDVFDFAAKH